MHRRKHRQSHVWYSLAQSRRVIAGLFFASIGSTIWGQVAPQPSTAPGAKEENIVVMEAFVTTGSNIKRLESENVLPVTVFNEAQIQAQDATTSLDLLQAIPQVTSFPKNETSVNAVASRGGNAAASLRGIGQENTLVLLNGRRLPYNPLSSLNPADSTVNVNSLPTVGLSQVEVLRDGASAIYGADAVAGVINYITNPNINGGTATVRFGATEHGGGMNVQGTLNFGKLFAGGRGRWVSTLSVYNRDAIYLRERDISASTNRLDQAPAPWDVPGSAYDGRSNTTQWPSFRKGTDSVSGTTYWFYPPTGAGPPVLTTTALPRDQYLNYNEDTIGQPFSTRGSLYSRLEFDLTPSVTAFGEVLGYLSKSKTGRQPISLRSSDALVTLSVDNPYNPYGSAFYAVDGDGVTKVAGTPSPITITSKLLTEGGPERVEASDVMYRILGGFKGTFGTSSWSWESAAMLGGYRISDHAINSVRESLLKTAALRTTRDAWNPFGYTFKVVDGKVVADQPYTNPDEVQDYYTQSADRLGHSRIASLDARTSGEVFELWAGPVSVSTGVEYRFEEKADYKPPYVSVNPTDDPYVAEGNNDILVMSPKYNFQANRTIASAYAETAVPLIAPKNNFPLATMLEATASVRFEHYSDFGDATKPKFGVNWKPVDWLMVRASYNEGFHAPDLTDMNQPASFSVGSPPGSRDPVRDNYFVGAGLASDVQVLSKGYQTPSPDLQPEESEGISAGVVVEIPFVKGLSFSVDYWEISQDQLIISRGRDSGLDEQLLREYTQQQLAAGVPIEQINVGAHVSPDAADTYKGDSNTLRAPVTADDIARFQESYAVLPQSEWIAPLGQWIGSTSQLINGTGSAFTNGFDYQIDYAIPANSWGRFRVTTTWSQFLNKFVKETPTDPRNDELVSMVTPEWKSNTTVQWNRGQWGASISATYESAIRINASTTLAGYESAGSPDYIAVFVNNGQTYYYQKGSSQMAFNLGVTYKFASTTNSWLKDTRVRLGVNNLLDDEPFLNSPNGTGYSGSTGSSLWPGRSYSLALTRDF